MKRIVLTVMVIFFGISAFAQVDDRTEVNGTIHVPKQDDPEGVSIYNVSSNKGTISDIKGDFKLEVSAKDTIRVTSVQFEAFTVLIGETVVASKNLDIYLNEVINALPEVVVSPYDLSGNINVDVQRLESVDYAKDLRSVDVMNSNADVAYSAPQNRAPRNTAMLMGNTRLVNGINFVNIFKELLINNKEKEIRNPYSTIPNAEVDNEIRKLYNDNFFQENLDIQMENINDFIYFADDNGLSEQMLKKGNELDLIDFLVEQSKKYKKQQARN
ncbi:hypothetical protein [Gillisia sp. Hel_I_29]|uniref:hypothetical protein n=1 Tax=Gillisia sp. Hel_I_29 TaxID=1249975 RepID=UPI00054E7618|nr:hypothetical protein [Gillisia sp. Hel_I_29]